MARSDVRYMNEKVTYLTEQCDRVSESSMSFLIGERAIGHSPSERQDFQSHRT